MTLSPVGFVRLVHQVGLDRQSGAEKQRSIARREHAAHDIFLAHKQLLYAVTEVNLPTSPFRVVRNWRSAASECLAEAIGI
jgi:hypothetical protein